MPTISLPCRLLPTLVLVASLFVLVPPASAHDQPFSYVDLHISGTFVEGEVVVHADDVAHELGLPSTDGLFEPEFIARRRDEILQLLEPRFGLDADGAPIRATWWSLEPLPVRQSFRARVSFATGRRLPAFRFYARAFPYDIAHQTFLTVHDRGAIRAQELLTSTRAAADYVADASPKAWKVIGQFISSGIHHILVGPDHLLFLAGLLLSGGGWRRLILLASAFTLGHSATLSLAVAAHVMPPVRLVESLIALSVVYVGAANLIRPGGRDRRTALAFAFGLIHGFGFANVLQAVGMPSQASGWALLSFNLGVELGQIAVVTCASCAVYAVQRRSVNAGRYLGVGGSALIVAFGAYWLVERALLS